MKLHEIIKLSENCEHIPFEEIHARKKQINAYFHGYYNCEAAVIMWNVTNSGSCSTICPVNELDECIERVIQNYYSYLDEEEKEEERELINFYAQSLEFSERL